MLRWYMSLYILELGLRRSCLCRATRTSPLLSSARAKMTARIRTSMWATNESRPEAVARVEFWKDTKY